MPGGAGSGPDQPPERNLELVRQGAGVKAPAGLPVPALRWCRCGGIAQGAAGGMWWQAGVPGQGVEAASIIEILKKAFYYRRLQEFYESNFDHVLM